MAHKEWQAVIEDWRKVPARRRYQSVESSGVRSHNTGKAGGKEGRQTVRSPAEDDCEESSTAQE